MSANPRIQTMQRTYDRRLRAVEIDKTAGTAGELAQVATVEREMRSIDDRENSRHEYQIEVHDEREINQGLYIDPRSRLERWNRQAAKDPCGC